MSSLTELVKARVEPELKAQITAERRKQNRSEGAIVRLALRHYFTSLQRKGA